MYNKILFVNCCLFTFLTHRVSTAQLLVKLVLAFNMCLCMCVLLLFYPTAKAKQK